MAETENAGAIFETRKDAGPGAKGQVRLWLKALDLAEEEEKKWRKCAEQTVERLRDEKTNRGARYNILYSNIETIVPALYNATPIPDVRKRHGDRGEVAKIAAQVVQRALVTSIDAYDFDDTMVSAVHDAELTGRGVSRVRYLPTLSSDEQTVAYQEVGCEVVDWRDFRHGPGRRWTEVPWEAFRHRITREKAVEFFGPKAQEVKLDWVQDGAEKDGDKKDVPDIFKRLTVWEIWDKEKRQVLFIAPSHKEAPLKVEDDPLRLSGFFPNPRPLYGIYDPNSLIPQVPYEKYRDQADELDRITRRIKALVACLKWRGIRAAELTDMDKLSNLEDGDFVPASDIMPLIDKGGLEKAIWIMPIDKLIEVIVSLVEQREIVKQTVFEITGIADIMRGQSDPDETLGAQRIKAQWGSLRVQKKQRAVQCYARDILRLKAELISEHFAPEMLQMISGIQFPDEVTQLLKSDILRTFKIDIETDSTIQADLGLAQQNMGAFVEGLGSYFTSVAPAVETGAMPLDIAVEIASGFARNFKLGKQAQDALDRWGEMAQQQAAQPQQPKPDPAMAKVEADKQAKAAELELQKERDAAELQMQRERQEAELFMQEQKFQGEQAMKREQMEKDMQLKTTIEGRNQRDKTAERRATMTKEDGTPVSLPKAAGETDGVAEALHQLAQAMTMQAQAIAQQGQFLQGLGQIMAAPKRVVRDERGRAVGVEPVVSEGQTIQ